jgi:hypothetical protein
LHGTLLRVGVCRITDISELLSTSIQLWHSMFSGPCTSPMFAVPALPRPALIPRVNPITHMFLEKWIAAARKSVAVCELHAFLSCCGAGRAPEANRAPWRPSTLLVYWRIEMTKFSRLSRPLAGLCYSFRKKAPYGRQARTRLVWRVTPIDVRVPLPDSRYLSPGISTAGFGCSLRRDSRRIFF